MTVIRLPSWGELLEPETPWARVLRSGATGVWLLRSTAEERSGLDARIVAGIACTTADDLLSEWNAALGLADEPPATFASLADAVGGGGWLLGDAAGVLVSDADRLLEDDSAALPGFLEALADAAGRLAEAGKTFRVVFQGRFDAAPDRLAVFREFALGEIG